MRGIKGHVRHLLVGCVFGGFGCTPTKSFLDERFPPPGVDRSPQSRETPEPLPSRKSPESLPPRFHGPVVPAGGQNVPAPAELEQSQPAGVDEFVQLAVTRNPRLARATIAIEAAQGRYVQAGLYPNPELAVNWDEIGDRTGAGGILTAPRVSQTIVTGKKLSLSQAVVAREVDQATLELISERYAVVAAVRASFYEAYTLQQRAGVLRELVKIADDGVGIGKSLLEAKQIARLDMVQLEVQQQQFRAELLAVEKELPAAYRRLASVTGENGLNVPGVVGTFDGLPSYDLDQARAAVLSSHPEVRTARVGVDRAQAAVRRAQAEPIPNVTVYAAYIRQYENKSRDGAAGVSMPIPVWNQNQGNIRAARAELGMAIQTVGRVENELVGRVAAAFQTYAAARQRADLFRVEILPRATETYELSMKAFKGGQFEYLRVIQAQRAVAEAKLELNKSLGDAWRSAAELSGLLLEDSWPGPLLAPPKGPVVVPMPKPLPPNDGPKK
ncbi:outer membrane efflux protein : Outer membrane efflux protein OS=Planctomyces limnophilus (strain ATCC 43296 / DSM 3776 / IFAM 1008 / 290) GN=Plim_1582 PE=4 SV=1: OEP: OEP [Gemmataceae bacterium]|nr:outer membrane efflux protein : Outer membrane efflux protein OS=Planctomyces limnophilus (strain ATCC 43296 / DSM 3776 / IFAM 1008 / 290) GN=Plim_1582 PE=4 SV=1: OEP: OEP [Gemmataceae bacterium]VTU01462.1 outer membrane efflux protein : Outer membrane efflux protein OS=Planctomyces limnophilus (strain ATCC 43296 / DSM 3776 / IFAM 1008 / 290) GN=Plim_1582 PE=4 SV=1: OEP: OEP [Gemmataceae bacterium]